MGVATDDVSYALARVARRIAAAPAELGRSAHREPARVAGFLSPNAPRRLSANAQDCGLASHHPRRSSHEHSALIARWCARDALGAAKVNGECAGNPQGVRIPLPMQASGGRYPHHWRSQGMPSLSPSILVPGQVRRK